MADEGPISAPASAPTSIPAVDSARASLEPGHGPATSSLPAPSSGRAARTRGKSLARELGLLGAISVLAATILAVCSNVLAARFFRRWDVTSAGLYTLSPPTLDTLHGLSEKLDIIVLLGQGDPDYGGLVRLLDQYRAESRLLDVRYVDPDRNPAEFVALSTRYRLSEGRTEDGRLISEAAMLIARGDTRWVIGAEDISEFDEENGVVTPRVEQAVTEGLRQVLEPTSLVVCVTSGHGEPALDDGGPTGLGALQYTLRRNNYETRELTLDTPSGALAAEACDLIVMAAPRDPITPAAAERLTALARRGKALIVSIGAALDEQSRAAESGLSPLFELFLVRARPGLVFERDPDVVLPVGLGGEAFLATPKAHAITEGLLVGGEPRYRVLLQLAQPVEAHDVGPRGSDTEPAPAVRTAPLLATSERAFTLLDATGLAEGSADVERLKHDAEGPFVVAIAAELEQSAKNERPGRLVLIGSASPLLGATWQDSTLAGTRRFVEGAVSWLVSRPALVSLPEKPGRQVDLRFTEESLSQVARYVLMYMPATALALGGLILYRRRSGSAARRSEPSAGEGGRS
jgi:gliding motility-associatede transport system auxiliary component